MKRLITFVLLIIGFTVVPLRADGHPCAHEFREVSTAHQSMHGEHHYVCGACSTRKYIDSSG